MISVILIWLYALITVFLLGYGFAAIWKKITGYSIAGMEAAYIEFVDKLVGAYYGFDIPV